MHPDLQSLLTLQDKDKAADALRTSLEALRPEEQVLDDELAQLAQAVLDARRNVAGAEARLQINFGRQGMKWLALEYAKLTAA